MSLSRCSSLVLPGSNLPWGIATFALLSSCRMSARQGAVVLAASAAAASVRSRALPICVGH
eukprot:7599701-Pyramimonas_sp.AAC.1